MADHLGPVARSRLMARVRPKDTKPEMLVRRLVHGMGIGYRLHRRDLPGTPDLVFAGRRKVVFVHGCFWHQHDCSRGSRPGSNREFWNRKLDKNIARDRANLSALKASGWSVLVVWECETRDPDVLQRRLRRFLLPERA